MVERMKPQEVTERLRAAIRLGEITGNRGQSPNNIYNIASEAADLIEQQARQLEEAREALSHVDCPRPINGRPDDFLATDCVKAGECGCCFRDALRFTLKEISNG